ncbi:ftsK/SpoIIIE family protein [Mycobacterium ulcerans str. Harvey]|uniref:FtsK/SpoIIIE family protein n=1 Tax=Mycobacterium ulcerans str. Harvey TaxID=1299332 RepID=A0ABP3A3J2_MYCUL|nr:ftsK/SpoIIIE family protein [Mycobacterium ulcerans str. Harvey]
MPPSRQDDHCPRDRTRHLRSKQSDQVRFMLADYRSGLLDAVPDTHLLSAGAINRNSATLDEAVKALAANLKNRLPQPTSRRLNCARVRGGADSTLCCSSTTGT